MNKKRVNDIFYSLQGEGHNTGRAAKCMLFYSLYYPAFNGLSRQTMMLLPSSLATFDLNSCIILYSSSNCCRLTGSAAACVICL